MGTNDIILIFMVIMLWVTLFVVVFFMYMNTPCKLTYNRKNILQALLFSIIFIVVLTIVVLIMSKSPCGEFNGYR
jgi:heme/copper-type cytochrome/quinol oxidase subunit 4